jgi:predicted  nucleic acid-binding Zn-ribbon protein
MGAFEDLLAVQEVDSKIDRLRHRLEALPEQAEQRRLQDELAAIDRRAADAEARREVVRHDQRRHEDEVATIEARIAHVNDQLYGSGITSPKEAADLQADLDSLHRRQNDLEDLVIEQMELAEPIDTELAAIAADRSVVESQLAEATAALTSVASAVADELDAAVAGRAATAANVPEALLATYEQRRRQLGGVAVARLVGNRCDGCHLTIPSAELEALRRAPADEVVVCPECTRMLVR